MSRQLCNYDLQLLCVNNYRGEEYNKPDTCVNCEECIFNPDNKKLNKDPNDSDKVLFKDKDFIEFKNEKKNKN